MGVAIGLGLSECPFKDPGDYWRWIDLCEAGGIDSMWQTDRLVGPHPMLETLTVRAALAGRTKKMKFGMNVLSAAFRDPVLVAKQCATIDFLSGGRLLPAFGIGTELDFVHREEGERALHRQFPAGEVGPAALAASRHRRADAGGHRHRHRPGQRETVAQQRVRRQRIPTTSSEYPYKVFRTISMFTPLQAR